jgi:vitamin-K-epoxide reductase (warfarin-sensitive)
VRYLIAVLAITGIIVSCMALRVHYTEDENEPCHLNDKWDCGVVNHSPYAEIHRVPVAAIGTAGYLLIGLLAVAGRRGTLLMATAAGFAFALYLTHIEAHVLRIWCLYCVISQVIIALLLLLTLGWFLWGRAQSRRIPA